MEGQRLENKKLFNSLRKKNQDFEFIQSGQAISKVAKQTVLLHKMLLENRKAQGHYYGRSRIQETCNSNTGLLKKNIEELENKILKQKKTIQKLLKQKAKELEQQGESDRIKKKATKIKKTLKLVLHQNKEIKIQR